MGIITFILVLALTLWSCQKKEEPVIEWEWEFLGAPLDDIALHTITIHPGDDSLWFVTSYVNGLLVTRDGGHSWQNYFEGGFIPVLELDPTDPANLFIGLGEDLYLSQDTGRTWTPLFAFPKSIGSILVSEIDHSVYVGIRWEDSETTNGIYKSVNMGETWDLYSYNVDARGLIPWDIEEDADNQKLYIATEIWDHPQPYDPPLLRSSDGGITWEDISGSLTWHALKIQVHPVTKNVYVLTEGDGLYFSTDFGDQWKYLGNNFWLDFIIDKNYPQRFWGGNHTYLESSGGLFLSDDKGIHFEKIGLEGHIVGSLCLNGNSTSLYVASYQSGIFVFSH